jgi:hypothetical protein
LGLSDAAKATAALAQVLSAADFAVAASMSRRMMQPSGPCRTLRRSTPISSRAARPEIHAGDRRQWAAAAHRRISPGWAGGGRRGLLRGGAVRVLRDVSSAPPMIAMMPPTG